VVAIQILDALELAPPPSARYGVSDGQQMGILDDFFGEHHRALRELMRSRAIPLLQLSTDDDVAVALRQRLAGGSATTATANPSREAAA